MILVTGATGFLGRHVVHELRAAGRDVRCLVRDRRRAGRLGSWGCDLVQGDVSDPHAVRLALPGVDAVVHLVSIVSGSPRDFERVMSQATRDLVADAQEAGVRRLVLLSALGTGPETRDSVPYYQAKWEMEQAAREAALEHVILRPSFVFGRDGGVLPLFVRMARYLPAIPIVGAGEQRIQPIWVEDVARYTAAAVDNVGAANRVFELGGPDKVTWNDLWERIKRVLGVRRATVHVPFGLAGFNAALLERVPGSPVTRDTLRMLALGDNTTDLRPALETFGLGLVTLDEQIRRAA